MNDSKPWRKKEETEINLMTLFKPLLRQWKQILLCAVVLACLLCAYKYRKDISAQEAENVVFDEESIKMEDAQWRQVHTAIALKKKIEEIQKYVSESTLMQLDTSCVNQATLLYSIDGANVADESKILQAYISYINNGAALEELVKADSQWADHQGYLLELFSAEQVTLADSGSKQILTEKGIPKSILFSVKISAEDASTAEQIMKTLQEQIDAYYSNANKIAGNHTLTLLSTQQTVKVDSAIAEKQQNKITQLATNQVNLNNLTVNFDENQKKAYELASSEGFEEETSENSEAKPGISKKWLVLGFGGGIFLYCLAFVCWYLLRDTVKNVEELRENYCFPVYGGIRLYKGKKGSGEDLSATQKDQYEREKAQMLGRIRLACQQQEITEICLATDFSLNEQEKELMTAVSKQLSEWNIKTVLMENITGNISMWDKMTEVGNLLMVCRINKTTHRMIDEEMAFFTENHLEVLGAAALED